MIVGVVREQKAQEGRVGLTPAGVRVLVGEGHRVLVEQGAGLESGYADAEYAAAGGEIEPERTEVYRQANLVVKVKEPLPNEWPHLREGQILFTYLHLAADAKLTHALLDRGVVAIAYETIETQDGLLPLLAPMSEIAGRLAVQTGAHYLERPAGGSGILLGGTSWVPAADVVILGGGVVGRSAAKVAVGMGARVTVIDSSPAKLMALDDLFGGRVETLLGDRQTVADVAAQADLLIGGVLVPGARAPVLVGADVVRQMKPGAVIVDVAIDQGGCVETSRPTSHHDPVYWVERVCHYCVTNMPGAVPRTATLALTGVTLPYVLGVAGKGVQRAVQEDPALARGINLYRGHTTHRAVAEVFGLPCTPLAEALASAH